VCGDTPDGIVGNRLDALTLYANRYSDRNARRYMHLAEPRLPELW
jgi:hypothetical protein